MYDLEAPEISRTLETGYPKEVEYPICPICGAECEEVYKDKYGDIVGCDQCVTVVNAYDCGCCYKED